MAELDSAAAVSCPLCIVPDARPHYRDSQREYWRCDTCALVFLSPAQRPSFDEEVARYSLHRNSNDEPQYLDFLSRLANPMIERVPNGARGLDYGCGQATALGLLMSRAGRPTASYDPAFRPDELLLKSRYDFVTCSEVVEHVFDPRALLLRFEGLVVPGGKLGVMTRFYEAPGDFGAWWYRRDPTHVCFYNEDTMRWIADQFRWELELPVPNVAIFTVGARHGVA